MPSTVTFRYGPEATPFFIDERGAVADEAGRIPFHGILSRGLLERVRQASDPLPRWQDHGHLLDEQEQSESDERACWRRVAADCGLLSFAQSAACARAHAEQVAADRSTEAGEDIRIALWNVKEGHTASVWHARLACAGGTAEFAVNVARDRIAGEELRRTSEIMQQISRAWPQANLARVHAIVQVQPPGLAEPVVVTRNDWIADSYEIHRLPSADGQEGQLIAVERFIADDSAPADIRRIRGRRLTESECARVGRDVAEFLARTAEFSVQLDINDGDLVWDGRRAVVVAIRYTEGNDAGL